jgi:hypothetical protein
MMDARRDAGLAASPSSPHEVPPPTLTPLASLAAAFPRSLRRAEDGPAVRVHGRRRARRLRFGVVARARVKARCHWGVDVPSTGGVARRQAARKESVCTLLHVRLQCSSDKSRTPAKHLGPGPVWPGQEGLQGVADLLARATPGRACGHGPIRGARSARRAGRPMRYGRAGNTEVLSVDGRQELACKGMLKATLIAHDAQVPAAEHRGQPTS